MLASAIPFLTWPPARPHWPFRDALLYGTIKSQADVAKILMVHLCVTLARTRGKSMVPKICQRVYTVLVATASPTRLEDLVVYVEGNSVCVEICEP